MLVSTLVGGQESGIKKVEILCCPGRENACADALSRHPNQSSPIEGIAESKAHVMLTLLDEDLETLLNNPPSPQDVTLSTLTLKDEQLTWA